MIEDPYIDRIIGEEGLLFRGAARDFVEGEVPIELVREMERDHRIRPDLVRKLGQTGYMGIQIPTQYGGGFEGDSIGNHVLGVVLQEELAARDVNVALLAEVSAGLFAYSVFFGGSEEQRRRYLPPIVRGEIVGAYALSEPGSGSDARAASARLDYRDDHLVLNGTKSWITNGMFADVAVIFAVSGKDSKGKNKLTGVIVPRDGYDGHPGYVAEPEKNVCVKGSGTARLVCEDLWLPRSAMLAESRYRGTESYEHNGFPLAMRVLDEGRLHIAADALGMMRTVIDACIDYVHKREAFGRPIAGFQDVESMIDEMLTDYAVARSFVYSVAAQGDASGRLNTQSVAMAKNFASRHMQEAVRDAIQIHGGHCLSEDARLEKFLRDSLVYTIFEGTYEINKRVIWREECRRRGIDTSYLEG